MLTEYLLQPYSMHVTMTLWLTPSWLNISGVSVVQYCSSPGAVAPDISIHHIDSICIVSEQFHKMWLLFKSNTPEQKLISVKKILSHISIDSLFLFFYWCNENNMVSIALKHRVRIGNLWCQSGLVHELSIKDQFCPLTGLALAYHRHQLLPRTLIKLYSVSEKLGWPLE